MVAYTFYETDNRVRRYAETLVRRGDEVDAIVLRREEQSSFDIIKGVNVYRIQRRVIDEGGPFSYLVKLLLFFVRSMWLLTLRHAKRPYDLIHVHSVPDFQVFSTLFPRLMGAKVILDIHDIVPELYASKFRISERSLPFRMLVLMEKLSVVYSNHMIVANHLWMERLGCRSGHPEKCTTILNYPDPVIFRSQPSKPRQDGEFVMCYPGTLSWHQGVDLIIDAMARLGDKAPNLRLIIFGDGAERERLTAMVKDYGLGDRVSIGGGIPIEQVASTMASVDLGIEPKRKRSFGNEALSTKILEFMAVGVPVLASNTRINRMYFEDGLIGFFESEDIDDLAAGILRLIEQPACASAMRERGLKFIEENNWNIKKHEYLDLVDGLVYGTVEERVEVETQ
ncbi:glycosyltransferase WbuB [Edaphobacter acidisoli]|uniref:Glycosyltransferase WbuB n=2 Tax=Edaphobacter acidisoli TaxID=2040573 RepID=A0A916RMR9_9BACT|nr:glycosyltransferase WbuB [Edaphobacter acidisoli]